MTRLPRTLLWSSLASRTLVNSTLLASSLFYLHPTSFPNSPSPTASSSRHISTSPSLLAAGQGSKELKVKKKTQKKVMKGRKGAKEEDGEDEDDEDGPAHSSKNARGRGVSEDTDALVQAQVDKASEKMKRIITWFGEKCEEAVSRGRGKVNAAALDSVRISLPKTEDTPASEVALSAVATVSTKANVMTINVFDETHTKAVEKSIFSANLPGISPVKFDARTIRVTIPRPSTSDRAAQLKAFLALGEQGKSNIRLARSAGLKSLGKGEGISEMQAITDDHIKQVDALLFKAKKELSEK